MNYTFRRGQNPGELKAAYRLRYETFVQEKGWWSVPEVGIEQDHWDSMADLFVAVDEEGKIVGTSRTFCDSSFGFQFDKTSRLPAHIERKGLIEVSRVAVTPQQRGHQSIILLGLSCAMCDFTSRQGYSYWGGLVVVSLVHLLERIGVAFPVKSDPFWDDGVDRMFVIASVAQTYDCFYQPRITALLKDHRINPDLHIPPAAGNMPMGDFKICTVQAGQSNLTGDGHSCRLNPV